MTGVKRQAVEQKRRSMSSRRISMIPVADKADHGGPCAITTHTAPPQSVSRRLALIERDQEQRLQKALEEISIRRRDLNVLRERDMDLKTLAADLEFQHVVLEDRLHKLQRSLEEKQQEVEAITAGGEAAQRELAQEYEFQVRQMKLDAQHHQHSVQADIATQMESILQEKVAALQTDRAKAVAEVASAKAAIVTADAAHQEALAALEAAHAAALTAATAAAETKRTEVLTQLDDQEALIASLQEEVELCSVTVALQLATHTHLRAQLASARQTEATFHQTLLVLQKSVAEASTQTTATATRVEGMRRYLTDTQTSTDAAQARLTLEESNRRRLHNRLQELKGNIRVFCRARPLLALESTAASITYPDDFDECTQEIVLQEGPSATFPSGRNLRFRFDKVFDPLSTNSDVFEEISQLVQSALDGSNVCVFAYGQTGSGKTHTMGGLDGMVPRAVAQIFESAESLCTKGWDFTFEGMFLEIYNEHIRDLLKKDDSGRLEIRHGNGTTEVVGLSAVSLTGPAMVEEIFAVANANRSVAATKANDRSSRSHSVFIIKIHGAHGNERIEGTLNLIDLAGSERLAQSQATGERLKETQAINKSLSSLGNVIHALRNEEKHVPYRNSKLTYLLQNSLGGNSKTLMFVNISTAEGSFGETVSSLRFAAKVGSVERVALERGER